MGYGAFCETPLVVKYYQYFGKICGVAITYKVISTDIQQCG